VLLLHSFALKNWLPREPIKRGKAREAKKSKDVGGGFVTSVRGTYNTSMSRADDGRTPLTARLSLDPISLEGLRGSFEDEACMK
jgi:hypothetical protein